MPRGRKKRLVAERIHNGIRLEHWVDEHGEHTLRFVNPQTERSMRLEDLRQHKQCIKEAAGSEKKSPVRQA